MPSAAALARELAALAPELRETTAGAAREVGVLDIPESTKGKLLELPACSKLQSTVQG